MINFSYLECMLGKNQHSIFASETFKSGKLQSEFAV